MKVLNCIFWLSLCVGLFIWTGCNIDIKSWMERQEIQYRMDYYRDVVIVDKHYDWDLLSDDWYISVKYDGKVYKSKKKLLEAIKEL